MPKTKMLTGNIRPAPVRGPPSCALYLAFFVAVGLFAPGAEAAQKNLERCRQYDADFDYTGVLTECGVAAGDPRTTPTERIEVFGLLGFAHTALGSPDKAQIWFLRMLALDPSHKLGDEVSPRFRSAFKKARRRFTKAGRVTVAHKAIVVPDSPPKGPLPISYVVRDPLGRVGTATVTVDVQRTTSDEAESGTPDPASGTPDPKESIVVVLVRGETTGDKTEYLGELPPLAILGDGFVESGFDVTYKLSLSSLLDEVVKPYRTVRPVTFSISAQTAAASIPEPKPGDKPKPPVVDESEGMGTGALIGLGSVGVAVVGIAISAAVGGGVAFYCLQNQRCTEPAPTRAPASSVRVSVE